MQIITFSLIFLAKLNFSFSILMQRMLFLNLWRRWTFGYDLFLMFLKIDSIVVVWLHSLAFSFLLEKLTVVHLVDAHLCCDPGKYVSALLLSLSTMLHLELPHINVLSKIDLVESYGKLGMSILWLVRCNVISSSVVYLLMWISLVNMFLFPAAFNLDFYTDVQDLSYLQYHLDQDPHGEKFRFSSPFNHMHLELWVHKGLLGSLYQ